MATQAHQHAVQAHSRLDKHEARLNEGQTLFMTIQNQMSSHSTQMAAVNTSLKHLAEAEVRRETREKTLADVAQQNQKFWQLVIPVFVTLIISLIGAIVWLVNSLPKASP